MDIVGVSNEQPNGIVFPVKRAYKSDESIFPVQEYDWKDIEKRLYPLVCNVIKKLQEQAKPQFNENLVQKI